jgi:hypothetical protein
MVSFKRMPHNKDLYTVIQQDPMGPMLCSVQEFLRTGGGTRMRVELKDTDSVRVRAVEEEVRRQFPGFVSAFSDSTSNQLIGVRVPTQYGAITVDLKTFDGEQLLPEHITDDVECILSIEPVTVICQAEKTVCTWVCTSLLANIKYN